MNIILRLAVMLVCATSSSASSLPEVTFEWFNHSTNEIWVTDVIGLPAVASPGRLMPTRAEGRLETTASTFLGKVRIKDQITVKWKDNGKQGWPGGLKIPGSIPPGAAHQAELKRDELEIPAKLTNGTIRFTYLGNDKWLVKLLRK